MRQRLDLPRMSCAGRRRAVGALIAVPALLTLLAAPLPALADAYGDYFKAVPLNDAATVKALLAKGFDPNAVEPMRGDTGMILALRENAMAVFDVLMRHPDIDVNAQNKIGDTALMIAAYKGNKAAAEALIAHDAVINRPGWTPLHYAAASGSDAIVRMLLDHAAYIDAESPNKTTPIMMAAGEGHIYTVKLLLDDGADATLKNELGMTAIDFAARNGHQDIVEGLTYRLKKAGKL